jgi:hypothetical protein
VAPYIIGQHCLLKRKEGKEIAGQSNEIALYSIQLDGKPSKKFPSFLIGPSISSNGWEGRGKIRVRQKMKRKERAATRAACTII